MSIRKISALAFLLLSTAAYAQTEAPAALGAVKDLTSKGQILGLEAWGAPGQEFLWLHDPKTGAIIAGFPFDAEGKSLNADHQGEKAVTLSSFIDSNTPAYVPPVSVGKDGKVSVSIPDAQIPEVESLLEGLDDAGKEKAISGLVEALRPVTSEAEFNTAVAAWIETLRSSSAQVGDVTSAPPAEVSATEPAQQDLASDAAPANEGKTLLQAMEEGFRLEAGQAGAPLAYALVDPSHAPSLAALKELKPQIDAGKLRLSILLVPASSEDAAGIVAGVLMADDPVATLFVMAEAGEGAAAATPFRRFSELPDPQEEGVRMNYALAVAYELPALPFFGFHATEGERYIKGIPSFEQFEGIGQAPQEPVPAAEASPTPVPAPAPSPTEAPAEPAAPAPEPVE